MSGTKELLHPLGTLPLETRRLLLRPFCMEDAEPMYRNWASDPRVTEFLTWPPHECVEVTRAVVRSWVEQYQNPYYCQWAIVPKDLGEPIGSISVVRIREKCASAELGWCIGFPWWGRGFMPEAGAAVLEFLFDRVGFLRVAAAHAAENQKSGRVMQKLGMVREGVLRGAGWCNHGIIDEVWYAILRDEYDGTK